MGLVLKEGEQGGGGLTCRAGIMASRGAVEGFRARLFIKRVSVDAWPTLGSADAQATALITHLCSFSGRYQRPESSEGRQCSASQRLNQVKK